MIDFVSIEFFWDGAPFIICSCAMITSLIVLFIASGIDHGHTNADIGILVIALVTTVCYCILVGFSRQKVRAQIDVTGMNLVDYQNLVDGIDNISLDGSILTIELSEDAFYRWYYGIHESTISASSNTLVGK